MVQKEADVGKYRNNDICLVLNYNNEINLLNIQEYLAYCSKIRYNKIIIEQ